MTMWLKNDKQTEFVKLCLCAKTGVRMSISLDIDACFYVAFLLCVVNVKDIICRYFRHAVDVDFSDFVSSIISMAETKTVCLYITTPLSL